MIIIHIINNDNDKNAIYKMWVNGLGWVGLVTYLWGVQSTLRPYGADMKAKS